MFDIEKQEELLTIEGFKSYIESYDVKYKESLLLKGSSINVLTVDNKELEKISRALKSSVDYGKGKHKFYYIEDAVIVVYNYFGWQGNYESNFTTNHIKLVKGDEVKYSDLLSFDEDEVSLRDIEKELKRVNGELVEKTKFKTIEDLIVAKPKLMAKYVSDLFNEDVLFLDNAFIVDMVDAKIVNEGNVSFPREVNYMNYVEYKDRADLVMKKINTQLEKREGRMSIDTIAYICQEVKELDIYVKRYDIDDKAKPYMIIGVNVNEKEKVLLDRFAEAYEKTLVK